MKVLYKKGDVTEAEEKMILHGCNAQGVMGAGVAKTIREKFPEVFNVYATICSRYAEDDDEASLMGDVIFVIDPSKNRTIANGITQFGMGAGRQIDYDAIYEVMCLVNSYCERKSIEAVAMPRIGAGLGGGNWRIIETIIEETAKAYQPVVYDL